MARRRSPPVSGSLKVPAAKTGEFERIARYFAPLAKSFPGALGLKDDAAILRHAQNESLVVTTDAMVAGVHFLPDDPPEDIAVKLLAVNLSDLAAMAAKPYVYTLVTSIPAAVSDSWLAGFARGLGQMQKKYGIALAGGDSVSTDGPVTLTITAFGTTPLGREARRAICFAPDIDSCDILVSGTIGDAAFGLDVARRTLKGLARADADYLLGRYRRPTPRLALLPVLRRYALAAIDISDGLVADIGHIAAASGVAIEIEAARVPLSAAVRRLMGRSEALRERVLTGGDDYEIAFAVRQGLAAEAIEAARARGVRLTSIGRAVPASRAEAGVSVLDSSGRPIKLSRSGWKHF